MKYVDDKILKPGTEVKFKKQFGYVVSGIIKGVWIGPNGIEYHVGYFMSGKFEVAYIPVEMFDVVYDDAIPAGFQLNNHREE